MKRQVLITGPSENQSSQKHAVYNEPDRYPSGLTWEMEIEPLQVSVHEFFENLFFSAERNGGNSFFYPLVEENQTLCRYEWHLPWRNRAAQIRLGVVFYVLPGVAPESFTAYLGTNEQYRERGSTSDPSSISQSKLTEFMNFIEAEVIAANIPRSDRDRTEWNFIFYARGGTTFWEKPFLALNRSILILPPVLVSAGLSSAIVIKSAGITKGHARREAMRRFQMTLALLTLVTGETWETSNPEGKPQMLDGKLSIRNDLPTKLFPDGKCATGLGSPIPTRALSVVRYGLSALDSNSDFAGRFLSALFAFYGGMIAKQKTPSLATVGFTACLGLLAAPRQARCTGTIECSECGPLDFRHNLTGDRAAISELLAETMSELFGLDFERDVSFENWVKQIYNNHRSQYVHSAAHQFSEFSQVFSSKSPTTTLVPTAIPSASKLVRKENEHKTAASKLSPVTRTVLIHQLLQGVNLGTALHALKITMPEFSETMQQEAYMGMPTSGWLRMTGSSVEG